MLTLSNKEDLSLGNKLGKLCDAAFDDSYPTGGESLSPGMVGMTKIDRVMADPKSGYVFEYDYSNQKLKAMYADYDAGADGALIEVANTTDLEALTGVKLTIIGF